APILPTKKGLGINVELLVPLSTALLAILTGFYVFLTYRILRATNRALETSKQQFDQQTLVAIDPYLSLEATRTREEIHLVITNSANLPALEVDVLGLASYAVEDKTIDQFKRAFVEPR